MEYYSFATGDVASRGAAFVIRSGCDWSLKALDFRLGEPRQRASLPGTDVTLIPWFCFEGYMYKAGPRIYQRSSKKVFFSVIDAAVFTRAPRTGSARGRRDGTQRGGEGTGRSEGAQRRDAARGRGDGAQRGGAARGCWRGREPGCDLSPLTCKV